jgi:hypothetical protein
MILLDMDIYGIDMGLLLPSMIGTTNELHADIVRRHPDRFRTMCVDTQTRLNAAKGIKPWNIDDALKEISTAGIGTGSDYTEYVVHKQQHYSREQYAQYDTAA